MQIEHFDWFKVFSLRMREGNICLEFHFETKGWLRKSQSKDWKNILLFVEFLLKQCLYKAGPENETAKYQLYSGL